MRKVIYLLGKEVSVSWQCTMPFEFKSINSMLSEGLAVFVYVSKLLPACLCLLGESGEWVKGRQNFLHSSFDYPHRQKCLILAVDNDTSERATSLRQRSFINQCACTATQVIHIITFRKWDQYVRSLQGGCSSLVFADRVIQSAVVEKDSCQTTSFETGNGTCRFHHWFSLPMC